MEITSREGKIANPNLDLEIFILIGERYSGERGRPSGALILC